MKILAPVGGQVDTYGIITAPNHRGIPLGIQQGKYWAADLGALEGPDFVKKINLDQVAEWLPTMRPFRDKCLFLAGGDIVGDAVSTLEAYHEFKHYFDEFPIAYVAQNGAENLPIPDDCAAVFVGGIPMLDRPIKTQKNGIVYMDWKDSMEAVSVIKRAQGVGKHVHIGRVNWHRRYKIFALLDGSENFTFDGTRTRFDGTAKTIRAWKSYQIQVPLLRI